MTQSTRQQSEILIEALRGQADIALAKLRGTVVSQNPSIKGSSREEAIREFIRCFLPNSYAIGHGEVFSESNEMSRQVDVIIHDELFSPVFKTADGGVLVPCEAVYGTAEVKTHLDTAGWHQALDNIASVKGLKRSPSSLTDILPNKKLGLAAGPNITITGLEHPQNPYVGIVICLKGLSADTIVQDLNKRVNENNTEKALLPDLIACVDNGCLIARRNEKEGSGFEIGSGTLGGSYDGFHAFHVGGLVLSSLHLGLNILLSRIKLKNRDLTPSWLDELLWLERKSKVEALFSLWKSAGTLPEQGGWDAMESEALARGDHEILRKLRALRRAPPV